jgi:hypothetical protein
MSSAPDAPPSDIDSPRTAARPVDAIAALDEVLGTVLRRELEAVGIGTVAITFDAPERDRAATWASPAINLFLYDLRESDATRDRSWQRSAPGPDATLRRAPLRLDCTYAITCWARATVDEHRLLSQVLAILLAYPLLSPDLLSDGLRVGTPPVALPARVAHGKLEGRADFWSAIGSPYKVSLELTVTVLVEAAETRPASPPVQRLVVGSEDARQNNDEVVQGGTVHRAGGSPAVGAVVVLGNAGVAAVVDGSGRFRLVGLTPGVHAGQVHDIDGTVTAIQLTAPGPAAALML